MSRFPTPTARPDGADALRRDGGPYDRTPTPAQPDGMRPAVFELPSPFGPLGVTVHDGDIVHVHGAWEGYPAAEYADELPSGHPEHARAFLRVAHGFTVNGKRYAGSLRLERTPAGVSVTHYAGLAAELTSAARLKVAAWAQTHWAELTPAGPLAASRVARANAAAHRAAEDARAARTALADAEHANMTAENEQAAAVAALRLEYLRGELRAERISYAELAELAELARFIDPADLELREAAGLPE